MNAERKLVPKLRFPEFRGTDGWHKSPLSKYVASLDAGVSVISGDRPARENEVGILKTSAITDGAFNPAENKVVLGEQELENVREAVSEDSIIISRMNTPALVGANAYITSSLYNLYLPDRLWAAKPKRNTSMRFIAFVLGSSNGRAALADLATGTSGSMKNITKPAVLAMNITTPSVCEQQKIADCLSSANELIAMQARKVAALKTHKNGLMQQLLPREGATQPHVRFKEFHDADSWMEIVAGKVFSNRVERGNSKLPIYSVTMNDGLVPRASLERRVDDIAEATANKAVKNGDIAYNMMRMWQGALGVATESCMVSPAYIVLEPQGVNPFFFAFLLKLPHILKILTAHSRGLTEDRLRLYYDDFAKIPLSVPSLPEQNRIAECFTSIDNHIANESNQLVALKIHKNGLMQQLFPSVEAIEA